LTLTQPPTGFPGLYFNVLFVNNGVITFMAGDSVLYGGVTSTGGQFVVDSGARLEFGGAVSLDAATSVVSAGEVDFINSVPTLFDGIFDSSGLTEVSFADVTFGESFAAASGNQIGSLGIYSGTVTFAEGSSFTLQSLNISSGTIIGPTDPDAGALSITVTDPSNPSGGSFVVNYQGTFLGAGTLIVALDATSLITGPYLTLDGWTLDQSGTTNVSSGSGANITFADNAQWINEGTTNCTTPFTFSGQGSVVNTGTWIVNSGGASYFNSNSPGGPIPSFDNPGLFEVLSGSMQFAGDVTTDPFGSGNAQPAAGTSNESSASAGAQPDDGTGSNFSVSFGATLVFTGSGSSEAVAATIGLGLVYFFPSYNFVFANGVFTATGSVTAGTSSSLSAQVNIYRGRDHRYRRLFSDVRRRGYRCSRHRRRHGVDQGRRWNAGRERSGRRHGPRIWQRSSHGRHARF